MKKLIISLTFSLIGIQALAKSWEYTSDSKTLFLVDSIKSNCESEFLQAATKRLKILEIYQQIDEVDGKFKKVTIMKTGFYGHPLMSPNPQVIYVLKMLETQKDGPIPADAGPFYDTTCELTKNIANKN